MPIQFEPFTEKYLEDAAALVTAGYRRLRKSNPALPDRYEQPGEFLPRLLRLTAKNPGLAALANGRLAGFMAGWQVPDNNRVFVPEWGFGAVPELVPHLLVDLYTRLAAEWVAAGYHSHAITSFADDKIANESWHWLGFGMQVVDAVRDLQPLTQGANVPEIRPATEADLEDILRLNNGLRAYLQSSPVYLTGFTPRGSDFYRALLQKPGLVEWLAFQDEQAVSFLRTGPAADDVSTIVVDEKTCSISGAFTIPNARGQGLAKALLGRTIEWASAEGYERLAVDFEAMNPLARWFWLRYFKPVCYSQVRQINPN